MKRQPLATAIATVLCFCFAPPGRAADGKVKVFILGERYTEHVPLIKTAWGGKSVWCDFRSPSAGKMTWNEKRILKRDHHLKPGLFYRKMVSEIQGCLSNIKDVVPGYKGQGYEIAGLAWFQGFNDFGEWHLQLDGKRVGMGVIERYPHNLAAMLRDLRKRVGLLLERTGWRNCPRITRISRIVRFRCGKMYSDKQSCCSAVCRTELMTGSAE